MNPDLSKKVWDRLIAGKSLVDLDLPSTNGRVDLRGLSATQPKVVRESATAGVHVTTLGNLIELRSIHWKGIDFSDGRFKSLRFFNSTIENCSFERAVCQDWRMWGTAISRSSFRSADLRRSALGGIDKCKRNSFHQIDFTYADLRQTAHSSADFVECVFRDANLTKVDFQGSVFVDCTFQGVLDQVLFYRQAFRGEQFPANQMRGVDFREAQFHFVEFRRLDMTDVRWPDDDQHILVNDYKRSLGRVLEGLDPCSSVASKKLAALLKSNLKWAGPNQLHGVISKRVLIEFGGQEALNDFIRLMNTK